MSIRAFIAVSVVGFGIVALAACTPTTPTAAPNTPAPTTTPPVFTTTASSAAPPIRTSSPKVTKAADTTNTTSCKVNPANAPVPTAEPFEWVPKADEVQVSLTDISSHTVQVIGPPVEVDLTVCNNSPVSYPQVGFVFALDHCSCSQPPTNIAKGTVQRFDDAIGAWVTLGDMHTGLDVGHLGLFTDQQPLPKGKALTLRYQFSYDQSMGDGNGGVLGAVVTPDGPHVLGQASISFTVNH